MKPTIGRIVTYRSQAGHDIPAIITATPDSACPEPPAEGHIHLWMFLAPGMQADWVLEEGVPFYGGGDQELGEVPAEPPRGTWRWPERA